MAKEKKDRKPIERGKLYHEYYKRTGGYRFLWKNMLKLAFGLALFGVFLWVIATYVIDVEAVLCGWFTRFPAWLIITTLFISECFTGILPPDAYILWAKSQPSPYLTVFILSLSSYIGGIISYGYGTLLYRVPRIKFYVEEKFAEQFVVLRKFGGLLIFLAAMAPLPYSPVSVVAGVIRFPFRLYWMIGLARFLRFFLYAFILYWVMPEINAC